MRLIALYWGAAVCALAVIPDIAAAQSQDIPAGGSEDIIVTAQRRSERLEDVPMAVTALTTDTLEKAGVSSLGELGNAAAGVQVGFGGAFTAPAVRGVSTITVGNTFENNVAVYFDGFYEPNTLLLNQDLPN